MVVIRGTCIVPNTNMDKYTIKLLNRKFWVVLKPNSLQKKTKDILNLLRWYDVFVVDDSAVENWTLTG